MLEPLDLIVIGTGTAGSAPAYRCRRYSNRRVAETCAMFKVIVDNKTDRVVGAHLLGPHAEEVINLFAMAIRSGVPATDLEHLLYAYPTSGSDVPYMI